MKHDLRVSLGIVAGYVISTKAPSHVQQAMNVLIAGKGKEVVAKSKPGPKPGRKLQKKRFWDRQRKRDLAKAILDRKPLTEIAKEHGVSEKAIKAQFFLLKSEGRIPKKWKMKEDAQLELVGG